MCCFSRPVGEVSSTRIFARPLPGGAQALVYAMRFAADEALAMVLPLPVAPGAGEHGARFVDLSATPGFFAELDRGWPPLGAPVSRGAPQRLAPLVVHTVGAFEASFVPTVGDFGRLDPRFRIDPSVWDALGGYERHGFAVFKLAATSRRWPWAPRAEPREVHPMALVFASSDPSRLFFPTVHVHDGRAAPVARFDHTLYAQTPGRPSSFRSSLPLGWTRSDGPLGRLGGPAAELVDSSDVGFRAVLRGELPNRDVWVSMGARPTEALFARVYAALFGGAGEAARARLAAVPELPGADRFEVALAVLRVHQGEGGGPEGLDVRLSSIDRDTFEAGRTPALRAWRRSGARYDPVEGARLARVDEAAWEAWLADPRAP